MDIVIKYFEDLVFDKFYFVVLKVDGDNLSYF